MHTCDGSFDPPWLAIGNTGVCGYCLRIVRLNRAGGTLRHFPVRRPGNRKGRPARTRG